jgi:ubiquinone/menaquinone biosynthesis C-methylase UbiE
MAELSEVREQVRARYAAAAAAAADGIPAGCCGDGRVTCSPADAAGVFGGGLYDTASAADAPAAALGASLGCGVPTAVAELREGEVVLDLGSGAGADVLISAARVGPSGKAIGLDMTDEMLALARANAAAAAVENVDFIQGYIEELPLADASIDVVISNCVINLSADKPRVIREAARVLRAGGRFAVSDVIVDAALDDATQNDIAAWTGCIAGALTEAQFRGALEAAGFEQISIRLSHRVHEYASSAVITATKPGASSTCCTPAAVEVCCEPASKAECCGTTAAGDAPQSCGCAH